MESRSPARSYSRPVDRSLQAYKAWIKGMTAAVGGTTEDDITEQEWQEGWRRFWTDSGEPSEAEISQVSPPSDGSTSVSEAT